MRRAVLLTLAVLAGGCGGGDRQPAPARAVMTERFPVTQPDFVATFVPERTGKEIGDLTLKVVETPGVRLAETDYEARVVRVLVTPGLDPAGRDRVRAGIGALPGIATVEPGSTASKKADPDKRARRVTPLLD